MKPMNESYGKIWLEYEKPILDLRVRLGQIELIEVPDLVRISPLN